MQKALMPAYKKFHAQECRLYANVGRYCTLVLVEILNWLLAQYSACASSKEYYSYLSFFWVKNIKFYEISEIPKMPIGY